MIEVTEAVAKQVYQANYKAKKRGAVDTFTAEQWLELLHQQNWLCGQCGQRLKLVITHVVPIRRGGLNRVDNLQGLCKPCADAKNAQELSSD